MGKIALVTGAAGGIGSAIALKLASCGYDVVLNYFQSKDKAEELQGRIQKEYKVKCLAIQADVAKEEEVDAMVSKIEEKLGGVDILINNAGIDLPDLFHQKTAEQFRRILDVNVKEKEFGRIVNISSTNGINTYYPMCFDYDASKAALNSLTHDLAVQFSPYVTVNAVAPGFIGTEKELDGYDEEFLKEECEKILVKRYGKPEEVAELVAFLVSEKANYINNAIIRIDGGQMGSC